MPKQAEGNGSRNGHDPDKDPEPVGRRVAVFEKGRKALELHLAGMPWDAVAEHTGYTDGSGAYKAAMSVLRQAARPVAEETRELEVRRLDRLLYAVWPDALRGDHRAVDSALKIMGLRLRLLGLDGVQRIDVTSGDEPIRVDVQGVEVVNNVERFIALIGEVAGGPGAAEDRALPLGDPA